MQLQQQLFTSRRMALQNELGAVDENIAGLKAHMAGLAASKESKLTQQQLLREQLVGMRELAKDGFVARNRLLELERGDAQLIGTLAEDAGNMAREQRQISELGLRRAQRLQEFQREVRTQLADVQKEVEAQFTRLAAQDFDLANAEVKAPVGGAVVGLTVFTHGGVVAPGAHLMEIVPLDDGLVIEGEVPVNLIDKVHAGLEVEMIFSAFNVNQTPHIPGIVTHVSADRMMNERTGVPSYKLKVKATPKGMKLLAKLAVRPGMPVDLFVKTGERNMMSYLLKPIFDRANTSMTEE